MKPWLWDARQGRWRLVDPELSKRHVAHFRIGFDPLDVPRDQFLVVGRAWQMCRTGRGRSRRILRVLGRRGVEQPPTA